MSDRRQRQKEQRAAKREAERKQESRRELTRRLGTAVVFGLAVVGIFTLGGIFGEDSTDLPGTYEDFRQQETACGGTQPPAEEVMSFEAPEPQTDITPSAIVTATITTSCGELVIELNNADAPETANSFVFLAREGFYDGQVFYIVSPTFRSFTGDPEANGTGGPGYVIADEYPDEGFVYEQGVVAMDNRGARSTGSRFFFVAGEDGRVLTNNFNVLGTVVEGEATLTAIGELPTATAQPGLPLETVYIESITIDVAGS